MSQPAIILCYIFIIYVIQISGTHRSKAKLGFYLTQIIE